MDLAIGPAPPGGASRPPRRRRRRLAPRTAFLWSAAAHAVAVGVPLFLLHLAPHHGEGGGEQRPLTVSLAPTEDVVVEDAEDVVAEVEPEVELTLPVLPAEPLPDVAPGVDEPTLPAPDAEERTETPTVAVVPLDLADRRTRPRLPSRAPAAPTPAAPLAPAPRAPLRPLSTPLPQRPRLPGVPADATLELWLVYTIGSDGVVTDAEVSTSSGYPGFDAAVRDFVLRTWRYEPPGAVRRVRRRFEFRTA